MSSSQSATGSESDTKQTHHSSSLLSELPAPHTVTKLLQCVQPAGAEESLPGSVLATAAGQSDSSLVQQWPEAVAAGSGAADTADTVPAAGLLDQQTRDMASMQLDGLRCSSACPSCAPSPSRPPSSQPAAPSKTEALLLPDASNKSVPDTGLDIHPAAGIIAAVTAPAQQALTLASSGPTRGPLPAVQLDLGKVLAAAASRQQQGRVQAAAAAGAARGCSLYSRVTKHRVCSVKVRATCGWWQAACQHSMCTWLMHMADAIIVGCGRHIMLSACAKSVIS